MGNKTIRPQNGSNLRWKSRQGPASLIIATSNFFLLCTNCRNIVSSKRIVYQNLDGMFYAPKCAQWAQRKMAFPPHSTATTLSEQLPRRLSGIILPATATAESVLFRKKNSHFSVAAECRVKLAERYTPSSRKQWRRVRPSDEPSHAPTDRMGKNNRWIPAPLDQRR